MFERTSGLSALAADRLTSVARELSQALLAQSRLGEAECIDSIRALEELVCVATAAQAAVSLKRSHGR